jgi:transcription initiation factor TFIIB
MASFLSAQIVSTVGVKPSVDRSYTLVCKDCKVSPPNVVEDFSAGDLVCGDCGLVLGNRIIDTRSEWRTFANSDDGGGDPSRVGATQDPLLGPTLIDSTAIGVQDGGSFKSRDLNRAHQRVIHSRGDDHILQAFKSIQHMGDVISLSRLVTDSAKQLYKKVDDNKLLKGTFFPPYIHSIYTLSTLYPLY